VKNVSEMRMMMRLQMNNINVVVDVPDEFLDDILTTAFEGGSNYWLDQVSMSSTDAILTGGNVYCYSGDEIDKRVLTKKKLLGAIEWYIGINGLGVLDDHDAGDSDSILQYALFGEVIYG